MSSILLIITNISSTAESPVTKGDNINIAAAIAGPVVGLVTITVVMVISGMLWIHWRKRKQRQGATEPTADVCCMFTYVCY